LVSVAVPRLVEPAENETEPVGLSPLTDALNVICPFTFPALGVACRVVALVTGVIVTPTGEEVLPVLLLSPA
jgi:hypothetical protein